MNLRGTLRKAAGLLVELPPEETTDGPAEAGGYAGGVSSTDAMWADLEKAAQTKTTSSAPAAPLTPPPTKSVEQIVRDGHGPNLDQIRVAPEQLPFDVSPGGSMDFAALYAAANLPTVPYTAEQALEMFASLPADLPLETRRQMVKAAVNSMGKAIGASPRTSSPTLHANWPRSPTTPTARLS